MNKSPNTPLPSPAKATRGRRWLGIVLVLSAAALLLAALKLPLWQMRMEAPQYRGEEALRVLIYPNVMRGDLQELTVLNHYIGVHVPETLPQFRWLPLALLAAAVAGTMALFLPAPIRRRAKVGIPVALALALLSATVQAQLQMRAIGHQRDPKAAMTGIKDFTPPLLGTRKIAQFEVSSRLGLGGYFAGAAIVLFLAAAGLPGRRKSARVPDPRTPARVRTPLIPAGVPAK